MKVVKTDSLDNLKDTLKNVTGGLWTIATWSPGDGQTRYKLVRTNRNTSYDAQDGLVALGKQQAVIMVDAFCHGYFSYVDDRKDAMVQ